ncbi:MAG TPA: zinc-dependent metalloprotease [Caldimonas sp.]|nr:zinc-dependent metalloprotease [Caldimonas sp.]HEX4232898.1 zinc-dependent metalloprotease [Caldimonas sp.]
MFTLSLTPARALGFVIAAAGALAGCTTFQTFVTGAAAPAPGASAPSGPIGPGGAASGLRPPGAPPVLAANGGLRPFADLVKDAKRSDGVIAFWQKDDKVWLELTPDDFDQPFFLSPKLKTGIGERNFYGGLMEDDGIVEFRRIHNQVQMIWLNTGYVAKAGTPEAAAIEAGYSPSLLSSAPVLSLPEPEHKAVLVEANALFLADLLGFGMDLQRTYRQGYAFDARNSAITTVRSTPDAVVLEVLGHYATASISIPQPGMPPALAPSAPRSLPDPRSLFLTIHYSLARLPAEPMHGRRADPRVGYFESGRYDFSNDLQRTPRQRFVNRWRLEKKDPAAALSEPVKPIVYWLDHTIPVKYRASITAGVLEWNKAFEKIGFKDAIRVEVQPDHADFDTLDYGRASIRWMTNASPTFGAIGPSHVDPRSGEILDADIGIESLSSRNIRAARSQILSASGIDNPFGSTDVSPEELARLLSGRVCTYGESAAEQMTYATDVLEARGDLEPGSAEAEAFVNAYLKDVTMHEVGHTLGLRHNFRASRVYTQQQLADPVFTKEHGITGSVMEYAPINLNSADEPRDHYGTPFNDTLGPYDYWAIEYAYRPLPSGLTAAEERAALEKIAGRSAEPLLAYGTDEDNFIGVDPETLQFDLGSDVITFAKKRIEIAQELLKRQETRTLRPDQDYNVLKRSVSYALRDVARAANVLSRQIGGVRTVRDAPGTGRDPLSPVPAAEQRDALDLITGRLLAADSFRVSPSLQRKLGTDFSERLEALRSGDGSAQTDYSPSEQVLGLQRALLAVLMSDTVATRLLESSEKAPTGAARALRMPELYSRLTQAVWSELDSRGDIAPLRREVQRDHVNRIAALLVRPGAAARADTRSTVRAQARALLEKIRVASHRPGLSEETKAHLADSADTLEQALAARLQRAGA